MTVEQASQRENPSPPEGQRSFQGEGDIRGGFCRRNKSSRSRPGKEESRSMCKGTKIHGLTSFTGEPDFTGNISRFKALFNKQEKCKPLFVIGLSMFLLRTLVWVPMFSKVLGVQRF